MVLISTKRYGIEPKDGRFHHLSSFLKYVSLKKGNKEFIYVTRNFTYIL